MLLQLVSYIDKDQELFSYIESIEEESLPVSQKPARIAREAVHRSKSENHSHAMIACALFIAGICVGASIVASTN